jgi:hypothetical protein
MTETTDFLKRKISKRKCAELLLPLCMHDEYEANNTHLLTICFSSQFVSGARWSWRNHEFEHADPANDHVHATNDHVHATNDHVHATTTNALAYARRQMRNCLRIL